LGFSHIILGVFEGSFSVADLDSDVGQCSGGWTSFSIDDVEVNSQRKNKGNWSRKRFRMYGD